MTEEGFQFKQPPHSREAEQSVLGALLLDNSAFEQVSWLTEPAFYFDCNRRLWKAIARTIEAGRPADVFTMCEELGDDLEKVGGPAYIGGLAQNTPSALNIVRYAELVRQKAVQRQVATVCTEVAQEALAPGAVDVGRLLDGAEMRILGIGESMARHGEGPTDLKPLLAKVFERIDQLYHRDNRSGVTGVPTGYAQIDQMTSGLQPGDLIIVAGRPSMGKTAFALNVAEHVAVDNGLPVVVFSMEMSGTQLVNRLLGSVGKIDQHKLRTGNLSDHEWGVLADATGKLHEVPLHIDEGGALTVREVRARARRMKRRLGKLGLIVIDYLQLMESTTKGENRATDIAEISRSLKAMAKELDVPVVALSQLNRAVDSRPDKRPTMSDLRESGAIEQDADVIMFIYRQVVYTPDLPEEERGIAEVIIAKQRNGPIGSVPLTFIGQFTRFENYASPDGAAWPRRHPAKAAKRSVVTGVDFKRQAGSDS